MTRVILKLMFVGTSLWRNIFKNIKHFIVDEFQPQVQEMQADAQWGQPI